MSYICSILTVLICLTACKKNNAAGFSGTYHSNSFYEVDAPVMYTVTGANTNGTLIQQFLERRGNLSYFTLNQATLPNTNRVSITFTGIKTANK